MTDVERHPLDDEELDAQDEQRIEPPKRPRKRGRVEPPPPRNAINPKTLSEMIAWRRGIIATQNQRPQGVAWVLAGYAVKHGYAFPGNDQLAKETGLGLEKVCIALAKLIEDGFIVRRRGHLPKGRWGRKFYLTMPMSKQCQVGTV
jgi:hypothetical protein